MQNLLLIIQIVISIALIFAILVQTKGVGFGRAWGNSGSSFGRRGLEKLVFRATFILVGLFILLSILQLLS